MSQALKTRINNLAAEVADLRNSPQNGLTVKGDDANDGTSPQR